MITSNKHASRVLLYVFFMLFIVVIITLVSMFIYDSKALLVALIIDAICLRLITHVGAWLDPPA